MISVEVYDVKYIILLMAGAYLLGNISPDNGERYLSTGLYE